MLERNARNLPNLPFVDAPSVSTAIVYERIANHSLRGHGLDVNTSR